MSNGKESFSLKMKSGAGQWDGARSEGDCEETYDGGRFLSRKCQ